MSFQLILVFIISLALYGCASDDTRLEGTIGSLTDKAVLIEPRAEFKINRQQVIDSYRTLVSILTDEISNGDELRRLSDLELEASLDNKLSDDVRLQQQGQQQSLSAISGYEDYLKRYPGKTDNDLIFYQLSRAYALESKPQKSLHALDRLIREFPKSRYIDEAQFRRGENLFVMRQYVEAEAAYGDVVNNYPSSRFHEKALYKYGWAQFKQNRHRKAIDSYIALLDLNAASGKIQEIKFSSQLSRAEQELLGDVLRVVSVAFSYEAEHSPMSDYFAQTGKRDYEPLLYLGLGELYLSKERITDASDIFLTYSHQYPYSRYTPGFHQRAISIYREAGYTALELNGKITFVNQYDVGGEYWKRQDTKSKTTLTPILSQHLRDLATHYHAQARISKRAGDYAIGANWYRRFLKSFPNDKDASRINFLLAESLFDARQYASAIEEYELTAYYFDTHKNSAEAGYAALLSYDRLIEVSDKNLRKSLALRRIKSVLKFAQTFPADERVPAVLLQAAQYYYEKRQYAQASQVAYRLVDNPVSSRDIQLNAWTIISHAHYSSGEFDVAEKSYLKLLSYLAPKSRQTVEIREQIAASIYKQGEQYRDAGNHLLAARHFSRLGEVIPESPKRVVADYDAATAYIELENWSQAISVLENFRKRYSKNKNFKTGVGEKLALAYSENENHVLAAHEMIALSESPPSRERKRDLIWRAADLFQGANHQAEAISTYKKYIKLYPSPLTRSMELRHRIVEYHRQQHEPGKLIYWLNEIVKADASATTERSARSKYLAANASLELIEPIHHSFRVAKLTIPLKDSLKKKKKLMQLSIDGYSRAMKYQVAEVTTKATYQVAEIYHNFAKALLESQRPKGLSQEALEEYELLLEEQAYPFEEKTIEIHLANLKRIPGGNYDESIRNSLKVLGELLPYRYAKVEHIEAYVELP